MAFGIKRHELEEWKEKVQSGEMAFLTHFWIDPRFPGSKTVTKAGCGNIEKLADWGEKYGLKKEWIDHHEGLPHFDLFGEKQKEILITEGQLGQIKRFRL